MTFGENDVTRIKQAYAGIIDTLENMRLDKTDWQHRFADAARTLVEMLEGARLDGYLFEFGISRDPSGKAFSRMTDFTGQTSPSSPPESEKCSKG